MKNLILGCALVVSFSFAFWTGLYVGTNSVKCPPCIENKCPSEDIWVNTAYGIMHFEAGEITAGPPYIMRKSEIDELYEQIEREILKQRGQAS